MGKKNIVRHRVHIPLFEDLTLTLQKFLMNQNSNDQQYQ